MHCVVGFLNPLCEGLSGHFDDKRYNLETITFNTLGRHTYLIYVGQYFDKTTLDPPILNSDSQPTFLDLYTPSYPVQPLLSLQIPFQSNVSNPRYWSVLCLDGAVGGLNQVKMINQLSYEKPDLKLCL